jgi:hypothetical protein
MTIWAERIADIGDWERVQNLFEEHFKALKGPREMMLICLDDDHRTARFVAALPDGTPLSLYEGFVEIQPDQLPKTAALLVGHQDSFEELFSFPNAHQWR